MKEGGKKPNKQNVQIPVSVSRDLASGANAGHAIGPEVVGWGGFGREIPSFNSDG